MENKTRSVAVYLDHQTMSVFGSHSLLGIIQDMLTPHGEYLSDVKEVFIQFEDSSYPIKHFSAVELAFDIIRLQEMGIKVTAKYVQPAKPYSNR